MSDKVSTIFTSPSRALAVIEALANSRCWFEFIPLEGSQYEIVVRLDEHEKALSVIGNAINALAMEQIARCAKYQAKKAKKP